MVAKNDEQRLVIMPIRDYQGPGTPEELAKIKYQTLCEIRQMNDKGYIAINEAEIPFGQLTRSDKKDKLKKVLSGLSFKPVALHIGCLIEVDTSFLCSEVKSSDLSRVYEIPGLGHVIFVETNYDAEGSNYTLFEESVNTTVGLIPAHMALFVYPSGNKKITLDWYNKGIGFRLMIFSQQSNNKLYEQVMQISETIMQNVADGKVIKE